MMFKINGILSETLRAVNLLDHTRKKRKKAIPVIETIMKFGYDLIKGEGIVFPPGEEKKAD
jgi:hypothetical protein